MNNALQNLIAQQRCVLAPFVYDGLQARVAQRAGHRALYMTGFGTAASHGLPDLGLLGMAEMVANVRRIAAVVKVPLIADGDTGYGGPASVRRTVEEYEAAGAAAVHIEDQVWPKRCGFLAGKQVVQAAEMRAKINAAVKSRRDLMIIARTDALEVEGWAGAAARARSYAAEGADLVFVDGIRTRDEAMRYADELHDLGRIINCQAVSREEARQMGYQILLNGVALVALFERMEEIFGRLAQSGEARQPLGGKVFRDLLDTLGAESIAEFDSSYRNQ